jgi:hypothetical protein
MVREAKKKKKNTKIQKYFSPIEKFFVELLF